MTENHLSRLFLEEGDGADGNAKKEQQEKVMGKKQYDRNE
jgi:hypothetical protein